MLAASLVSLFVVVLGSAPSQAAATRVGAVVSGGSTSHAGPVEVSTSPDVDAVALDLAGLPPVVLGLRTSGSVGRDVTVVDEAIATAATSPQVRGPPAR